MVAFNKNAPKLGSTDMDVNIAGRIGRSNTPQPTGRAGWTGPVESAAPAPAAPAPSPDQANDPAIAGRIGPGGSDRRIFPRKEVHMQVSGRRMDHSVAAHREPVISFKTRDVSVGGLKAVSQTPLRVGERVNVFFPPESGTQGWDAYGRVLRVTPTFEDDPGYTVAVEFEQLAAA